jgi:hypothetical protein
MDEFQLNRGPHGGGLGNDGGGHLVHLMEFAPCVDRLAAQPEALSCAIARRLSLALIKAKRVATAKPKAIALLRVAAATSIGHKPLDGPRHCTARWHDEF